MKRISHTIQVHIRVAVVFVCYQNFLIHIMLSYFFIYLFLFLSLFDSSIYSQRIQRSQKEIPISALSATTTTTTTTTISNVYNARQEDNRTIAILGFFFRLFNFFNKKVQ